MSERKLPGDMIPHKNTNKPFRYDDIVPGRNITIEEDENGIKTISSEGGSLDKLKAGENITIETDEETGEVTISSEGVSLDKLKAGENITIETDEETGEVTVSSVDTIAAIQPGENVSIVIDDETGESVISFEGEIYEDHYKGVFSTTTELRQSVQNPEDRDWAIIRNNTVYIGGSSSPVPFTNQIAYYYRGTWYLTTQYVTFTEDTDLIKQYQAVGSYQPIYLHKVSKTGSFNDLNDIPRVETPNVRLDKDGIYAECATEGAEIWYTTDGSMPHVNGTKYTQVIAPPLTLTRYRFVAIKNGYINSFETEVSSGSSIPAPTITIDHYKGNVVMTGNDQNQIILYTTDGSDPVMGGEHTEKYESPFTIANRTTFRAAIFGNNSHGPITEVTFEKVGLSPYRTAKIWQTGEMTFSFLNQENIETYYTLDGSTPSYLSDLYESPIRREIYGQSISLKYISYSPGMIPSNVNTTYFIGYNKPSAPTIVFDGNEVSIVATSETVNVIEYSRHGHILYTTDGTLPSYDGDTTKEYSGTFTVEFGTVIKAIFYADGEYYNENTSDVTTRQLI